MRRRTLLRLVPMLSLLSAFGSAWGVVSGVKGRLRPADRAWPDAREWQKLNEAVGDAPRWQSAFWGGHYPRLFAVKAKYDPEGLFYVHHGVGSEAWSNDGFTRVT